MEKLEDNFPRLFRNSRDRCLLDVWRREDPDYSVRPNQLLAVSLPYSPLPKELQREVVETVTRHLVTPYGLRTLSPRNPAYRPCYEGDGASRDAAYHQGTVWPWWIGPYADALIRVHGWEKARVLLWERMEPLLKEFPRAFALATVPEIFNGNPPHTPKGAIHQAWNTGEIIRVLSLLKEDRP